MTDFRLTLRIDKIGDLEALNALNALDAKGRRIVEGVSGATGRAMGEVALAYERGTKSMRLSLESVAKEHEKNIAAMVREERAADALGRRQGLASLSATRGIEQIVRSGTLLSSSLDQTLSQVSQLAFGFGVTGPIVGAIGVATVAMVGFFRKAHEETVKLAREMAEEINRISHQDLASQALTAQRLYSGDESATDITRFGISQLRDQQAALRRRITGGTSTFRDMTSGQQRTVLSEDAASAAEQLKVVEDRLNKIVPLYNSIVGVGGRGGTLEAASRRAAAMDLPGFITDEIHKDAKLDRAGEKAAKKLADAYEKSLAADMKSATKVAVQQMVADAETTFAAQHSIIAELVPDKKKLADSIKDVIDDALEMVKNDPLIAKNNAIDELAERLSDQLKASLREGLAGAFEAAFSGGGIEGGIKALAASVLGSFGNFLEQLGESMLITGTIMTAFVHAMHSLNGPAMVAAGIGLIAAGAAMKALAGSFGGGSRGGDSYGGGYSGGSGLASIVDRGVINPDTYSQRTGASITPRPAVTNNVTIIGPNDPSAQRAWDELQRKSQQRGSLASA